MEISNKIKKVLPLFLLSLLSLSQFSCTDNDKAVSDPSVDNTEGITFKISIPKTGFGSSLATREEDNSTIAGTNDSMDMDRLDTEMGEGKVHDLYLVILEQNKDYPDRWNVYSCVDISKHDNINGQLNSSGSSATSGTTYSDYNVILDEGSYKLYLLGNLQYYWLLNNAGKTAEDFKNDAINTEYKLEHLTVTFPDRSIRADALPMACMPKEFRITNEEFNGAKDENGVLTITPDLITAVKSSGTGLITIIADMKLLCSKVRYTVLFDCTEGVATDDEHFSNQFPVPDISFTDVNNVTHIKGKVTFFNILDQTNVYEDELLVSKNWENVDKDIFQTHYPNKNDESQKAYFDIGNSIKVYGSSPSYLTRLTETSSWNPSSQRAWQSCVSGDNDVVQNGSIYLPENPTEDSDSDNVTTLRLFASGTGVNDLGYYNIPIPKMKRGYFYDIVAKMINSTALQVEVFVKVKPWEYNSYQFGKENGW